MQVIRKQELATRPWKNGGGVTREIASATLNSRLVFRLSMADVSQGGPFSDFAGLTRILTVIQGGAMRLHAEEQVLNADLWKPVEFDGALKIDAELVDQPLTDFNLMFDPEFCHGVVDVLHSGTSPKTTADPSQIAAIHVLTGEAVIADNAPLHQGDTALLTDQIGALSLAKNAAVMLISIKFVAPIVLSDLEIKLR